MTDDPSKRRGRDKAQSLLLRFPVTDLARAVALTGSNRASFLKSFVNGYATLSYRPVRMASQIIYGASPPLFDIPLEPWEDVERHIRAAADEKDIVNNLLVGRKLFDLVRSFGYRATLCEEQPLRVAFQQNVWIGLKFYITQGDKLIFQFPHPRIDSPSEKMLIVLGSIIHHAYVKGDYNKAEIEIADLGCPLGVPAKLKERVPRIRAVNRDSILGLDGLTEQIEDVYDVLRELSAKPT